MASSTADVRTHAGTGVSQRARGHGEFLRLWESSAPLSESQLAVCSRLEDLALASEVARRDPAGRTSERPSDAEGDSRRADEKDRDSTAAYAGEDGLKGLASVTNAEEFRAWHAEMERRLEEANEEKYRSMLADLTNDRNACAELLAVVDGATAALERVKTNRRLVDETTSKFRADCETMLSERKRMGELADALRRRLTYFEELETLTAKFGGGKDAIAPTHPDFVKLLHRLDECVAYASSSTGAVAEADGYLARFLELQKRAFTVVRDHTVALIRQTSAQVAKELREERAAGAGFRHADMTDASKEYLRFRTVASRVKSLMTELHERAKAPTTKFLPYGDPSDRARGKFESTRPGNDIIGATTTAGTGTLAGNPLFSTRNGAMTLYNDCEECFVEQRKRLLEPSVFAHIRSLGEVRNMIALARLGSSHILRVCHLERQLYEHFFPVDGDEDSPVLGAALEGICDIFYTELRPQILQERELDKLVYLIEVLKTEILGDEIPRRGKAGAVFAPAAIRAIADAQERIIYRAEVFLRDEIRGFEPDPEHLDYPERILGQNSARSRNTSAETNTASSSNPEPNQGATTTNPAPTSSSATAQQEASGAAAERKPSSGGKDSRSVGIYSTWYPPVERTLRLLSMLYRCVDGQVFAGVAQEAVSTCVKSVTAASTRIAATQKPNSEDHAQLFLVWQLLMTREQISPFDVDMSYTEHELDFYELRSLLGSVIRGQLSVRSLATPPTVREKTTNSKQDLDRQVRQACEAFILKTTRELLDPVLSFLAKCNAMPASSRRPSAPGEIPASPPTAPFDALKGNKGSFAHPLRLKEAWEQVEEGANVKLPEVVERMKIYITKPASRAVLLRPVRGNIAEASAELLSALQARYTLDERAATGIDGAAVQKVLDKVDACCGLATHSSATAKSAAATQ